ncbi:hypothetical protein F511_44660, partial [Dorcoceras hygrometricum]
LRSLLECRHGGALEPQIGLEVLCDFPDQPLEGELAYEELGRLLVLSDFTEGDGPGAEAVGFLHSAGCWGGFPGGLGGKLLSWGFAAGGLPSSLLRTRHLNGYRWI